MEIKRLKVLAANETFYSWDRIRDGAVFNYVGCWPEGRS